MMHEGGVNTPFIIIIAGPNGAGKSTLAKWYLKDVPDCAMIVDPDAIARELVHVPESERHIAAGRMAIEIIVELMTRRASFAIETTLSGKTLAAHLETANRLGYAVRICMLWVPSVDLTITRVQERAAAGGHDIPVADQIRRFGRTYINFFELYESRCHEWSVFIAISRPPREIATGSGGFASE